jgi:peptidoglycan/xylan/chitin deacetylase (PgdA/CDA1 family)
MRVWHLFAISSLLAACGPILGGPDDDPGGDDDPRVDGGGGGPGPDAPPPGVCRDGLGPWTGNDNVAASAAPPCGLAPAQVPQLVSLGWDDNGYSGLAGSGGTGGMHWAVEMLGARRNPDGTAVRNSFYMTSVYADTWGSESPTFVKRSWQAALAQGHEIGNHTRSHATNRSVSESGWRTELQACLDLLTRPFDPNEVNHTPDDSKGIGAARGDIVGFRTPFLEYNDSTLKVVKDLGFRYDCSIEEGYQYDQDGTNYFWPYTLDNGSPGHDLQRTWPGSTLPPLTSHPGLWELPVHPVIVPPDERAAEYGIPPGLRQKLHQLHSWFDPVSGKITGFDYNLWVSFRMTKAEFVATLKHTLDLRLEGNRAPFMFGTHTDYYSSKYTAVPNATLQERQEAIEEFLDYALAKPMVRVLPNAEILEWVRNPVPL